MRSWQERFWSKVQKTDGCWIWLASHNGLGCGKFFKIAHEVPLYAHRVSYEIANGVIPASMDLDHLCRNPFCVNPDHLEMVTHRENMRRGKAATKMSCKRGHDWSDPKNVHIRKKTGIRWCAACHREFWSKGISVR